MSRITPTVGRVVHLFPNQQEGEEPQAAIIAKVNSDDNVNLGVFNTDGHPYAYASCPLVQGDDPKPEPGTGAYCAWMPYQLGQAAKTEAAEAAASALAGGAAHY